MEWKAVSKLSFFFELLNVLSLIMLGPILLPICLFSSGPLLQAQLLEVWGSCAVSSYLSHFPSLRGDWCSLTPWDSSPHVPFVWLIFGYLGLPHLSPVLSSSTFASLPHCLGVWRIYHHLFVYLYMEIKSLALSFSSIFFLPLDMDSLRDPFVQQVPSILPGVVNPGTLSGVQVFGGHW